MALSIVVATAVLFSSASAGVRIGILWLALVLLVSGIRLIQTCSTRSIVFVLLLAVVLVFAFVSLDAEAFLTPPARLLAFTTKIFAGAAIVATVLAALRLLTPLKSGLLTFSLAMTLSLAAIPFELRQTSSTQRVSIQSEVDWSQAVPDQLLWAGPTGQPTPGIEWGHVPGSVLKNYYPDNPRGYFDEEDVYGRIDLRMAELRTSPGAQVIVARPTTDHGSLRVEPHGTPDVSRESIQIEFNQIPFLAGVRYRIIFWARSDEPRSMVCRAIDLKDEANDLGLAKSVAVTPQWAEHVLEIVPASTASLGALRFQLGSSDVPIEIKGLSVRPMTTEASMNPSAWSLEGRPDSTPVAAVEGDPRAVRLQPQGGETPIRLCQRLPPVSVNVPYVLSFRARSDAPLRVKVGVASAAAPGEPMSDVREIELSASWHFFGWELSMAHDESSPLLVFEVDQRIVPFELGEVMLWPRDGYAPAESPKRYSVRYFLNGEGFRDEDHPLTRPADVFRIACIGDSYTFGQGVQREDTFPQRLGQHLNQSRREGPQFSTMNFGVCGHTTHQERMTYEHFAKKYQPNVVLVTMVFNDNMTYEEEKAFGMHDPPQADVALVKELHAKTAKTYKDFGYEVCVQELKLLAASCRENGAQLVVVLFSRPIELAHWEPMEKTVTEGLAGSGIPLLNLRSAFPDLPFAAQMVHRHDGHPNEIMHRIAAKAIADFLQDEGLVGTSMENGTRDSP